MRRTDQEGGSVSIARNHHCDVYFFQHFITFLKHHYVDLCMCFKVGQRQPGLFGFLERTLAKTQDHIWFERTEMKDRLIVTRRYVEFLFFSFCGKLRYNPSHL